MTVKCLNPRLNKQTIKNQLRITNKQTKNTRKFDMEVQSEILIASTQVLSNKQINKNKQKHKQIWRGSLIWNFECSKIYQTNRLLFFNKEITFLIEMMCCFHLFFDQRKTISLKFWSILFLQKTDLGMFRVF